MTLPAHRFGDREERAQDAGVEAEALDDVPGFQVPDLDIWKPLDPGKDKDFEQARRYLDLVAPSDSDGIIDQLKQANPEAFRADDLLRACRRAAAPVTDPLLLAHLYRLIKGKKFHWPLIVSINGQFEVADGFHRLSVAYHLHNQLPVPVLRA